MRLAWVAAVLPREVAELLLDRIVIRLESRGLGQESEFDQTNERALVPDGTAGPAVSTPEAAS